MVGLHRVDAALPCAPAVEVGWRLHPDWWGHGYATEAAAASLRLGFESGGLDEIVAFTTTLNTRSQAVMERLGMVHDADGDFDHPRLAEGSPLRRHVLYPDRPVAAPSYGGDMTREARQTPCGAATGPATTPRWWPTTTPNGACRCTTTPPTSSSWCSRARRPG